MYAYKLATNWQIFTEIYVLSLSENIPKSFVLWATFLTNTVHKSFIS